MAQTGFVFSDEGRTLTVLNDSGTTAITAGDLCGTGTNDNVLTGTAASARNAYGAGDIKVFSQVANNKYGAPMGVALADVAADGYGGLALEGFFIHAVSENVEAGDALQFYEGTANKLSVLDNPTTTVNADVSKHKCGRALTGGSADGKYILWKLSL